MYYIIWQKQNISKRGTVAIRMLNCDEGNQKKNYGEGGIWTRPSMI